MATNIEVPAKTWIQCADVDSVLHVKIPKFTKIYYVETTDDPNDLYPEPQDSDPIKVLVSPPYNYGFIELQYTANNGPIWLYTVHHDVYVIREP